MAGQNFILKRGDILFREGDSSNGMYIVRKGAIQVFLDNSGQKTSLATIKAGSMLGEMALFDHKPRSASAVAIEETEVTLINNEDFSKILKQIPKWFVSLMVTLSSRLRETNIRLQTLQESLPKNSAASITEFLQMLSLCFYKFGQKEQRHWTMLRDDAESTIAKLLRIKTQEVTKMIDLIVNSSIITSAKDGYGKSTLVSQNRGDIDRIIEFMDRIQSKDKSLRQVPPSLEQFISLLNQLSKESAYDIINMEWDQLLETGRERALDTSDWLHYKILLNGLDESIEVRKNGNKEVIRIDKNKVPKLQQNFQIMSKLSA